MSLQTVIEDAAIILNQAIINGSVLGTQDRVTQELVEHSIAAGRDIIARHDWGALNIEAAYTITPAMAASGRVPLPGDFDRFSKGGSVYIVEPNGTRTFVQGAASDAEMALKRRAPSTSPRRWRRYGNDLVIYPNPVAGTFVWFQYLSRNWITTAAGGVTSGWLNNTDSARFPELLLLKSIIYRHKRQMGLQYADEMNEFEADFEREAMQDASQRFPASRPPSVEAPG